MAAPGGKVSPIPTSLVARAGQAARWVIQGVAPDSWFGPSQPLQPVAPPEVAGRQWDYPFGANLNYIPRSTEPIGFGDLRALADNLPLLRAVIETRKDQIASLPWDLRVISDDPAVKKRAKATAAQSAKILDIKNTYLRKPDRQTPFAAWLRMLLEDMLVIDAATIYPRPTLGGDLYSLDAIDGSSIKPLLALDGRRPEAPSPAYQQILHGVPAADFTVEELQYLPRNVRTSHIYGFSGVEQIIMTVNIALRRDVSTLEYYRSGTIPDAFGTLPK